MSPCHRNPRFRIPTKTDEGISEELKKGLEYGNGYIGNVWLGLVQRKMSNRFPTFEKNFQNLTFFLPERDIFHEIENIFDQNLQNKSCSGEKNVKF